MTVPLKSALASLMIACAVIQVLTMFELMGLKNLFSRGTLPYSGKPVTDDNIRAQLAKPAQNMPAQSDLSTGQVNALLAYLHTI
jgi:hypothetical protein